MFRFVPTVVCGVCVAVMLSACASSPLGTGVGASSKPVSKKSKRLAAKNCRSIKRDLRRLEKKRDVGSKAYDKAIAAYVRYDCEGGRA